MRLKVVLASLAIVHLLLFCAPPVTAGALSPCIKAVTSQYGHFLVITDMQVELAEGNTRRVRQLSFQILPRENFISEKDKISSPATFWTDWTIWSVILDAEDSADQRFTSFCPLPLISDDGEFLALLSSGPTFAEATAMRIYRKRNHYGEPVHEGPDHGVFIKEVPLKELWPADKLEGNTIWNDHSPQWFASGTFEFSPDCQQLIHRTRWGNSLNIKLLDGTISIVTCPAKVPQLPSRVRGHSPF